MRDDFAVFILSHGRANHLITLPTVLSSGYTGKWYIVIDDEDKQRQDYINNFGIEHILMFNKDEALKTFDIMDNLNEKRVIVYARNICFKFAKDLKLKYFLELDDDYRSFSMRVEKGDSLSTIYVKDLDSVFNEILEFLEMSGAHSIAFSQNGDFIGGINSRMNKARVVRKAMNAFFCKTDRPFKFSGRLNEDVTTYVSEGSKGKLFMTIADINLNQLDTQQTKGGMSDSYLALGTYTKSFYTVMSNPSSVKISEMITNHTRIHHQIDWNATVPKIVSGSFKRKKLYNKREEHK